MSFFHIFRSNAGPRASSIKNDRKNTVLQRKMQHLYNWIILPPITINLINTVGCVQNDKLLRMNDSNADNNKAMIVIIVAR